MKEVESTSERETLMKRNTARREKPHTVKVMHPSYQPSRTELREDVRVKATFKQAVKALGKQVKVEYVKSPEDLG